MLLRRQAMVFWLLSHLTYSKLPSPKLPTLFRGTWELGWGTEPWCRMSPALCWMAVPCFTAHPKKKIMSLFQMGTQETENSVLFFQHAFVLPPGIPFVRRAVMFFCCWSFDYQGTLFSGFLRELLFL